MTLLMTESSNLATSHVTSMAIKIWNTCSMKRSTLSPKCKCAYPNQNPRMTMPNATGSSTWSTRMSSHLVAVLEAIRLNIPLNKE